jgi:hypothetical protein
MNAREFAHIRSEYDMQETIANEIVNIIAELITIPNMDVINRKLAKLFELNKKLKNDDFNIDLTNPITAYEAIKQINWYIWRENTLNRIRSEKARKIDKKLDNINRKLQNDFAFDPKRTVRKIINDSSPLCDIEADELERFWSGRWSNEAIFNEDELKDYYEIERFWDNEMNKELVSDLLSEKNMECLIKKRGNLSAPGLDYHTFPVLKLEKRWAARFMCKIMRSMLNQKRCPDEWKKGKTILLYKGNEREEPINWRPITLTSIFYRIIFGRISQAIMKFDDRKGKTVFSHSQKGFVPRISGCSQHITQASIAINLAKIRKNDIYILAIDLRDAFGSCSTNC